MVNVFSSISSLPFDWRQSLTDSDMFRLSFVELPWILSESSLFEKICICWKCWWICSKRSSKRRLGVAREQASRRKTSASLWSYRSNRDMYARARKINVVILSVQIPGSVWFPLLVGENEFWRRLPFVIESTMYELKIPSHCHSANEDWPVFPFGGNGGGSLFDGVIREVMMVFSCSLSSLDFCRWVKVNFCVCMSPLGECTEQSISL